MKTMNSEYSNLKYNDLISFITDLILDGFVFTDCGVLEAIVSKTGKNISFYRLNQYVNFLIDENGAMGFMEPVFISPNVNFLDKSKYIRLCDLSNILKKQKKLAIKEQINPYSLLEI